MSSERQLLEATSPWWGEHIHRYREVIPHIISSDIILDLACGTGFGADILASHTEGMVIGGDIAINTIQDCIDTWKHVNLSFKVLDGTKLPYENFFFDKIVSFETIEHTKEYYKMLKEFYRVLKKRGLAFISTPNFIVNSPSGSIVNPYHTQEFTYNELNILLKKVFGEVKIYGQKYSRYIGNKTPKIGKIIEWFFSIPGIRKIPYKIKNKLSLFFIKKPFYPTADDYTLVDREDEIIKCKTFFCICRK